jgi:hypothetical protein
MAELKGDLTFYNNLDTTSGKTLDFVTWGKTENVYEKNTVIDYATLKGLIEQTEVDIDANQDVLDKHNATVEVDIDDEVLNLLKG